MAKELCLTPGGPVSVHRHVRQKAYDRESAEVIVPGAQTGKDLMYNALLQAFASNQSRFDFFTRLGK